jgi:hypothetical protein
MAKQGKFPNRISNDLLSDIAIGRLKILKILIFQDPLILNCEAGLSACIML